MKEKATQKTIDGMIDRLSHLKARHSRLSRISRSKDREEWPDIKALLEDQVSMCKRNIEGYTEYADHLSAEERVHKIDASRHERDSFEWVINLIEKPDIEEKKLKDAILELEHSISVKRDELKEWGEVEEART